MEKWIMCKIGNGRNVLIRWDLWFGCNGGHRLSIDLVIFLNSHGVYYIADVARDDPMDVDKQV